MSLKITDAVTWVGKKDWELRRFHGEEYSTHKGSTYNSYLVRDEKTALIDTVWGPYAKEFVQQLAATVELAGIDYVIVNHAEPDHSGALPELMRHIPGVPVYCTANAVKSITGQHHIDLNFQVVKTGQRLSLGKRELIFIEGPCCTGRTPCSATSPARTSSSATTPSATTWPPRACTTIWPTLAPWRRSV